MKQSETKDQTGKDAKIKGSNYNFSGRLDYKIEKHSMTKSEVFIWILKRHRFLDTIRCLFHAAVFSSNGWGIFCSMASVMEHALRLWSLYMQLTSRPLPAQGSLLPIKAGEEDWTEGGRKGEGTRQWGGKRKKTEGEEGKKKKEKKTQKKDKRKSGSIGEKSRGESRKGRTKRSEKQKAHPRLLLQ